MTDKEFKRLSRAQLIEIIYQLQLQIDKLNEEKQAFSYTGTGIKFSDEKIEVTCNDNSGNVVLNQEITI